jgi:hypothetical protein
LRAQVAAAVEGQCAAERKAHQPDDGNRERGTKFVGITEAVGQASEPNQALSPTAHPLARVGSRAAGRHAVGLAASLGEIMGQHNFSDAVVKEIAQKAMYICANPDCLCLTGYSTTEGKPRSIAEGAHVLPSGTKGPRAADAITYPNIVRSGSANGLWLCRVCHAKVDDDQTYFSTEKLFEWKRRHEEIIRRLAGKDLESALLDLRNEKRHHQETREFVSFIENKRVLYEGLDVESPPRVLESLELIRERLLITRAHVNPDSKIFSALNSMQRSINDFLRRIGAETDLKTLRCDSNDPVWRTFAEELKKLRTEIIIILKVLSGDAGYKLTWV